MHPIIKSIKSSETGQKKNKNLSKQLVLSGLKDALKEESYESCKELIEFAQELGVSTHEIDDVLEGSLEEEKSFRALMRHYESDSLI